MVEFVKNPIYEGVIDKASVLVDKDSDGNSRIHVEIKLNISEQQFYHLELAINEKARLFKEANDEIKEKYGDASFLVSYLEVLGKKLRKEFDSVAYK